MVNFYGNGYNGGRGSHRVSGTNHGRAGAAEVRQYVIYNKVRGILVIGGNSVGNDLHWTKTGDGGTVCGAAADIWCMRKGDGVLWGGGGQ